MDGIVFIGDELTSAGFRLTGIETVVPTADETGAAFDDARKRAAFVILTAETAKHIRRETLDAALLGEAPLVAVITDIREHASPPDLARRLRATLGIEE